jgi:hypothetical protein
VVLTLGQRFDLSNRSWTLIPEKDAAKLSDVGAFIAPVAAVAEIFRRAMWSELAHLELTCNPPPPHPAYLPGLCFGWRTST